MVGQKPEDRGEVGVFKKELTGVLMKYAKEKL
jgi:hypothetical protein